MNAQQRVQSCIYFCAHNQLLKTYRQGVFRSPQGVIVDFYLFRADGTDPLIRMHVKRNATAAVTRVKAPS
jgi:hypothetical protein